MARTFHTAESLTESSSTTLSPLPVKASLTFTPDDNSTYVIFYSCRAWNDNANGGVRGGLYLSTESNTDPLSGGSLFNFTMENTSERQLQTGFRVETYGVSPGSQTIELRYSRRTATGTAHIDNARIFALKLESGDFHVSSQGYTNSVGTTLTTFETLSVPAPASPTTYYAITSGNIGNNTDVAGSRQSRMLVQEGGLFFDFGRETMDTTTEIILYCGLVVFSNRDAAFDILLQGASNGGSSTYGNTGIVALSAANSGDPFSAAEFTDADSSSGTYADFLSSTFFPLDGNTIFTFQQARVQVDDNVGYGLRFSTNNGDPIIEDIEYSQGSTNFSDFNVRCFFDVGEWVQETGVETLTEFNRQAGAVPVTVTAARHLIFDLTQDADTVFQTFFDTRAEETDTALPVTVARVAELTGLAAGSAVGTVTISGDANTVTTGEVAGSALGAVEARAGATASPAGVSATGEPPGTVTFGFGMTVPLTGVSGAALLGAVTVETNAIVFSVTGVEAGSAVGSIAGFSLGVNLEVNGFEAPAILGDPIPSTSFRQDVTGFSISTQLDDTLVWGDIVPSSSPDWTEITP